MFIPLGDAPNDSDRVPWVNYALIAVNVLVFVWARASHRDAVAYGRWVQEWGLVPAAPRLEAFLTHMFMHGGFLHLAGNMLYLWVFGDNVERRLGHGGYLLFYVAGGLAAVLVFRTLDPLATVPLVGASGAIFGVEGYYFLAFPRNQVRILVWILLVFTFWVPARLVLGLSFVTNLFAVLSPQAGEAGGGVAYAAHVGGFVAGFLLAGLIRLATPRTERVGAARSGQGAAALGAARRLIEERRYEEAERELSGLLRHHLHAPEAPEAALLLGLLEADVVGRPEAARAPLAFAARLHPDPAARAEARAALQRLGS